MKLKHIALAAMLVATGAANAAVDSGAVSGDGTFLASVSFGNGTAGSSASFNLGLTYSQLAAWQGAINTAFAGGATEWTRSWNLSTGVYGGTGLTNSVIGNYGTVLADFNAAAVTAGTTNSAQLQVMALDGVGTTVGSRGVFASGNAIDATGNAVKLGATINSVNNAFNSTTVNNFFGAVSIAQGATSSNLATTGATAYFNNGGGMEKLAQSSMFDTNGQYNGQYAAGTTTFAGKQQSLAFYNQVSSSTSAPAKAALTAIGYDANMDGVVGDGVFTGSAAAVNGSELGVWTLQGNELKFSVTAIAAPVPEPESYAMLLAGLGLMGAVARRRRNAR
jgi:hypothetical protein